MDEHIATITRCMDQVLAGREISREEAETRFAAGKHLTDLIRTRQKKHRILILRADQRPRFLFGDRSAIQNLFRPLQDLFAAAFHYKTLFLNPPAAWPGLAFVIPYVSYVIEIFVFDNGNISMHLCWLL